MKTIITFFFTLLIFTLASSQNNHIIQASLGGKELASCQNASFSITRGECSSGFLEFTVTAQSGSSSASNPAISITFPGNRTVEKTGAATQMLSSTSTSMPITFTNVLEDIENTSNTTRTCTFKTMGCDLTSVQLISGSCSQMNTVFNFFNPVAVADPCNCNDPQNVLNADGSVRYFHDVMTFTGTSGDAIACLTNCAVILDNAGVAQDFSALSLSIPASGTLTHDFWRAPGNYAQTDFIVGGITAVLSAGSCDASRCNNNVPTMSQWGLIILGLGLLIFCVVGIKVSSEVLEKA